MEQKIGLIKKVALRYTRLRKISNQKHRVPLNANLREQYHDTLKAYKKLLNTKKMNTTTQKSLSKSKMQKSRTNQWMTERKDKDDIPSISEDNWFTYFRSLHSKSPLGPIQQSIMNDLNFQELQKEQFPSALNYLITENEPFIAAEKLQNTKSAFPDKIKNEMICPRTLQLNSYFRYNA